MRVLRQWVHRLLGTLRPIRHDEDLAQELRMHAELAAEQGRRVSGTAQAMDALRDQRGLPWIEDLVQDVRHGLRTLRRSPVFTAVALLTLALGIGANTAIFTIVNGVLLRPLGYSSPEQLMFIQTTRVAGSDNGVSPPEYMEFRELAQSFSAVGAYRIAEMNLSGRDRPVRVRAAYADTHLLDALGVQAAQGRLFAPGETEVSGPLPVPGQAPPRRRPVAILSHELWRTAFGEQPMVGQTIEANGVRGEVIGVMPPGVDVMDNRVDIWIPLGLNPANRQNRGNHVLDLVGRLRDGVTVESARREVATLVEDWDDRVGVTRGPGAAGHVFAPLDDPTFGHSLRITPLQEALVGSASRTIWILQAAVGLVMLIACANLANLLLARAERRRREFALRRALGARQGRLVRQLVAEGLLLSIAGGAVGLFLARVGVDGLIRMYPATLPRTGEVALDGSVVLFTVGVSMTCGVLIGLAPIVSTRIGRLVSALKEGGAQGATGAARHHLRRALAGAEVALSVMLVIGAALLVRTAYNLMNVDGGFDRSRLVTFSINLPPINYLQASARREAYQRIIADVRALSGVQAATAMSGLPLEHVAINEDTDIDNYEEAPGGPEESVEYYQYVMSGYFETMGIPIVAGRSFRPSDAASPGRVVVVNETLADTFWRAQNPIGQRLRPACCGGPWYTVVGVAKDVRQGSVDQEAGTEVYFFAEQALPSMPNAMTVVLRLSRMGYLNAALPAAVFAQPVERVVRAVDPDVPVVGLRHMETVFAESIRRPTLIAQLFGAFGILALLLAAIGTYGVLSYIVAERRRDIGIRLALGADRGRVLREVLKQGLQLTMAGVVAGLAGALGLSRLIASLLFGVEPNDPATIAAVVVTTAVVALFACWLPAFRASRLDPNAVLRAE